MLSIVAQEADAELSWGVTMMHCHGGYEKKDEPHRIFPPILCRDMKGTSISQAMHALPRNAALDRLEFHHVIAEQIL